MVQIGSKRKGKEKREREKSEKDEVRLFVVAVREFSMQQGIIFAAGYIENEETHRKISHVCCGSMRV